MPKEHSAHGPVSLEVCMSIDLSKQWPSLLSYYVGFPADGAGTYIENIYKLSKQNKANLAAKLGLPDTLTVEEEVTVDLNERFAFSYQLVCMVMPKDKQPTFDEFITNRTSNQMKLSNVSCPTPRPTAM